jgi:Zn-dependent peptidase ImmA (M78 family)
MFDQGPPEPTLIDALRDFLPIAVKHLNLDHIPKIKLVKEITDTDQPTFGRYVNSDKVVYVVVDRRNPVDVLRTLAHELVHYAQGEEHRLDSDSGRTGSPIEDEANAEGGVIMRLFNQAHPNYMQSDPIELPN